MNPTEANAEVAAEEEASLADLIAEWHAGSEDAAWKLVELYMPHVRRVVRASLPRAIRSKVDSIDLANTLFGSLLIKRHRLVGVDQSAQFLALLTKAARNRVVDEHRKYTVCAARDLRAEEGAYDERVMSEDGRGVAGDGQLGGREQTPSQTVIAREKWSRILATLDRREREVVSLKISGSTYQQIAEQLSGVSERTARRIVSSVVEQLKE